MIYRLLSVLLLSLTCFYSIAQAGDHRVTINGTAVTLKSVFKAIKKQTGFAVMYNTSITMLNQEDKVSVSFKNTPLDEVLEFLLKDKNLAWTYNDDVVIIHKKPVEAPKKNEEDSTVTPTMISGKVTDAGGSPLPGVTVQVKGTSQGTTTDGDGKFTLPKVKTGEVLMFSSVGFETRTVTVKGRSVLTQMNMLVNALDETVVVAYGETTRRLSTGNIATVKAKDIEKQPVTNPLLALQGRVPGLFIEQATGIPGTGVKVRIQGQNSLSRGSDPLYVIDGVPYISQMLLSQSEIQGKSGEVTSGNPLSYINPADIESIEVLKDADATSIYGSRAAAGAILITTKKGKAGKTQVDFNIQTGWSDVGRFLNLLNTPQYLEMRREAKQNDGENIFDTDHDINGFWDTTRYTDWQRKLIGKTARYTNAQLSVSGGTAGTSFLVSLGYNRQSTVFPGDVSTQQMSMHFNINHASANGRFRLQSGGQYLADRSNLIQTDLTSAALRLAPNAPNVYDADGNLNWATDGGGASTWDNPLAHTLTRYRNNVNNLVANTSLSYDLMPGLSLKTGLGYTHLTRNELSAFPLLSIAPENRVPSGRASTFGNDLITSWNIEPQVTFQNKLSKGKFEALVGATFLKNDVKQQRYFAGGFSSDLLLEDVTAAATISAGGAVGNTYKYNALFARLNYNWDNKYIVNISARRDGSSRFGSNNHFHNFASVGAAWIFSNERFAQILHPFLSFGKVRASYGTTGNDQIGDYQFMNLYFPRFRTVPYQETTGLSTTEFPNPYLQWEETRKLQAGLESGFLNDRLLLNVTYYLNRSSNQLQLYALPIITGTNSITANFPATIQNSGWEITLNTTNVKVPDFSWTSTVNLTIPTNKLIAYDKLDQSSYADLYIIGQPFTISRLYKAAGVDPATGLFVLLDSHGTKTSMPVYPQDANVWFNTTPKYYGGMQHSINYKGFSIDLLLQFVRQKSITLLFGDRPGLSWRGLGNQPTSVLDRWQKPGDNRPIQRFSANYSSDVGMAYGSYAYQSDAAYEDASYIRLKNLSLSWHLPSTLLQKMKLQHLRTFIQGQNLLTITGYSGLDPETASTTSIPPLRVWTIGIQITL
jgi:TonB-linked SusC/RagA family outer membrane protein